MKNTYEYTKLITLTKESQTVRKFLDEMIEERPFISRLMNAHGLTKKEALEIFDTCHQSYEELWEMGFQRKVEIEVDIDNDYKETRIYSNPAKAWRKSMGYGGTSFDEEQA